MRILLTGASGYMGRPLAAALAKRHQVTGTYLTEPAPIPGCGLVRLDLTDAAAVGRFVKESAPEVVIHAAADSKPEHCEKHPEEARRVNVAATETLSQAAAGARFLYISTDLVFDGKKPPYREDDPPNPMNLYGRTKVSAERAVLARAGEVLRLSLCYGWKKVGPGYFTDWLHGSLAKGEKVSLFTDQRRAVLLMEDAVTMIERLLDLPKAHAIMHMAGPRPVSRFEFGKAMCEVFGFDPGLVVPAVMADVPGAAARPGDCSLDGSKLNLLLGFAPRGIREGLERLRRAG